jgi:hypothetical protein
MKRTRLSSFDYGILRSHIDGRDPFMDAPNVVASRVGRARIPQGLTLDKFRQWLIKKYPYATKFNSLCPCYWCQDKTNRERQNNQCNCRECRQTNMALKWWTVVADCWFARPRKTGSQVEKEQGWRTGTVGSTVQQISLAWAGLRQDKKPRSNNPRGRPKGLGYAEIAV